MENADAI
jgi:hypothetical protein